MDISAIEAEIMPKSKIKIRIPGEQKQTKKTRLKTISAEVLSEGNAEKAQVVKFQNEDPMENCNKFLYFVRDFIRAKYPSAKFYDFQFERSEAANVIDYLITSGKDSKEFLISWLEFYCQQKLNDASCTKPEKTSIKSVGKTFAEYSTKYINL